MPALSGVPQGVELHMPYRRPKAESVITGLEKPINEHLLKLMAVRPEYDAAQHWRREVLNWLDEVADIRLKPEMKTAKAGFYFRILFDEPFGGTEVASVARRLQRLAWNGCRLRDDADAETIAADLEAFHRRFATGCARGELRPPQIAALLEEVGRLAR